MYQAYVGFGENKIISFKLPNSTESEREHARYRCIVMAACGMHCGLMLDGEVVFNTNENDAEYLKFLESNE